MHVLNRVFETRRQEAERKQRGECRVIYNKGTPLDELRPPKEATADERIWFTREINLIKSERALPVKSEQGTLKNALQELHNQVV